MRSLRILAVTAAMVSVVLTSCLVEAHAGLIDHGDFTSDTLSGLDWLDVTLTQPRSYQDVLGDGGGFITGGWHIATGPQLATLFTNYIDNDNGDTVLGQARYEKAFALSLLLGATISFNNNYGALQIFGPSEGVKVFSDGLYDDGTGGANVGVAELSAEQFNPNAGQEYPNSRWVTLDDFWPNDAAYRGFGVFMVRQTPGNISIPEPTTLAVLGTGLTCAIAARRRTKKLNKVQKS